MSIEVLIPLMFYIFVLLLCALFIRFSLSKKKIVLDCIHSLLKADREIEESTLKLMLTSQLDENRDLRKSILLISLAIAICIFSLSIDFPGRNIDPNHALFGIAAIPGMLGLGYLVVHYMTRKQ